MVSTLEKEMCMMHQQLDKYKETRDSTELLTAEVESISAQLEEKVHIQMECQMSYSSACKASNRVAEIYAD
jgi:hypothetical protein